MRNAVIILLLLTSCSYPAGRLTYGVLRENEHVEMSGWLAVNGEYELYSTKDALRDRLKFPHCVSGVMGNHHPEEISRYSGKLVKITGIVKDFESLPLESDYPLARKIVNGTVVVNNCFGPVVLLIERIELR